MANIDEAAGRAFYDEQIRLLQERDIDTLIDTHYAPDAVLISFEKVVRGRDALKEHFRGYVEMLGHLDVLSTDDFVYTGDGLFFTATVDTQMGQARVYDTWTLVDGLITHHFTGMFP
jgi:ketosteroid isomerase-like protein